MKAAWWMAGGSVASAVLVAGLPGVGSEREVLLGMLAPLAGAVFTWVLVIRTYATRPERLTPVMIAAFAAKVVFFGAYVTLMLTTIRLQALPFVISFTAYFIALHVSEAFCLQRLFAGSAPMTVDKLR